MKAFLWTMFILGVLEIGSAMTALNTNVIIPRTRGSVASNAIRDSAHMLRLNLEIDVHKNWLTEHGRFTLQGDDASVDQFKEWFQRICHRYETGTL